MARTARRRIAAAAAVILLALPALAQVSPQQVSPQPGEPLHKVLERQQAELERLTRQVEAMAAARTAALRASPAFQESFTWYRLDGGQMDEMAFAVAHGASDGFGHGRLHPDDVRRCGAEPYRGGPERQPCPMRAMPAVETPGVRLAYHLRHAALRAGLDEAAELPHLRAYDQEYREKGGGGSRRYVAWLYVRSLTAGDDPAWLMLAPVLRDVPEERRR